LASCGVADRAPYDDVPARPPAPRELDRALDRLGAAVGEERLAAERRPGEPLREPQRRLGVVEVRRVPEAPGLLAQDLDEPRVAVPELGDGDAREEVEVLLAVGVPQARPLAAHERDGLARVRADQVRGLELPQLG
jgi:hypothetical protein